MTKLKGNNMATCFCGNTLDFKDCCLPIIEGKSRAISAEQLMRSRYSACCTHAADYLIEATHKSTRKLHKKADILSWSKSNKWQKLEIITSTETIVEFRAFYSNGLLGQDIHHEKSTFVFEDGSWYYVDGIFY